MYEKQSRNNNRSTDTIASFLLKTYQILEHPEYERMISWDKSNVGFIIHDVVSFTREILPKYFRHSNFSSFVRQLNMYDFHKVKQENESLVFKNPLFCKGQQQNLKFIRRKAAKKVGGQRKTQNNDRVDAENQKYENLLKGFKKSFETEINHSLFFYQRSIQLVKDLNDSNIKKQQCMTKLYEKEEAYETAAEDKEKIQQIEKGKKISSVEEWEQKPKKDTIIQIPRQFLTPEEPQRQKQNKSPQKSQVKQSAKTLKIDCVLQLKQQVYKSIGIYQSWLQDYIDINKKKVKYMSSTRQQLVKCRENKSHENQDNNYGMNSGDNFKQEQNEQGQDDQGQNNGMKLVSLEEINEKNQKPENENEGKQTEDNRVQVKEEEEKQINIGAHMKSMLPMLKVFDQAKPIDKSGDKVNGSTTFQQGGFIPINDSFSTRLFSTFSKPKDDKPALQLNGEQSACDEVSSNQSYEEDQVNGNENGNEV